MVPGALPAAAGSHPEREDAPEPVLDRLLAGIGFRWHSTFRRRAEGPAAFAAAVGHHARRWTGEAPAPSLPELRYRLRRDGLQPALLAECFGHYCAALAARGQGAPGADAMGAALILLQGGIAEVAAAAGRRDALGLAATTWAIYGVPVHLVTASEGRTRAAAEALQAPLAALGSGVGAVTRGMALGARRQAYAAPVVCGTQREIAHDYLRDRLALGSRARSLTGVIHRLAGDSAGGRDPVLAGLKCALVEDADAVLLDDAPQPIVIASDAEQPGERLVYEQALELARALARDAEFTLDGGGAQLTESGIQRIDRLAGALGGIWAARQQREGLIALALAALHLRRQGVDYRVEKGRVTFAGPAGGEAAELVKADETLQRLIEVKEGCRPGPRPDVRARLSLPRFFRRYLHLAGVCADARGAESEFWALYGLKTTLAGAPASRIACAPRVFATVAAKRKALVERARAIAGAGSSLLVAIRTPAEAGELSTALAAAGVEAGIVKGGGADDRRLLDQLESAGGVALVPYPAGRELERSAAGQTRFTIIAAELHDARRHLARICRTFTADSYELLFSLEDAGMADRIGTAATWWARRRVHADGEFPERRARWLAAIAQRRVEYSVTTARQDILLRDRHLDDLLAFSGKRE